MIVKTDLTQDDFTAILSQYDLGTCLHLVPIQSGTVQTNYYLLTTMGKFVFRYYEMRSKESVLFESDLLLHLLKHQYPCPTQIENRKGRYVGEFHGKPYVIFDFIEGQPIENPNFIHWQQLVQKAAELQKYTQDFRSIYTAHRWNYGADLCLTLAHEEVRQINTPDAQAKFAWLSQELEALDLPQSLPKGICHCDFHFSNTLFRGDELVALLDFDDANYTFLQFDLVGLIEHWAWSRTATKLDDIKARAIVQEYVKHRPLPLIEQNHLYDVYKLSVLFDCVWYFARGSVDDFYEKKKIEFLDNLGKQNFTDALFRK